jgi:2,3-diketo-5-methylthiopentyl-1-phosphate enolase
MFEDYVLATYHVDRSDLTAAEFERIAIQMAVNAGVGTWTEVTSDPKLGLKFKNLQKQFGAELSYMDFDTGLIKLAVPSSNIDVEYGGVPFLLNTVAGDVLGLSRGRSVRLVDLELPDSFVRQMPGPNVGVEGLRKAVDVDDRPLLAFSVKPRIGLSDDAFARITEEALLGGVDIVEDDTRLLKTSNSSPAGRASAVRKVMESSELDKTKLYSVNVTGRADKMNEVARTVIEAGATALKIDVLAVGFSALQSITEYIRAEHNGSIPILVYPAMYSVYDRVIDRAITLALSRLCGADVIYAGTPRIGSIDVTESDVKLLQHHRTLLGSPPKTKRTLPSVAAGLHPGMVEFVKAVIRHNDFAYFIGGGIAGYPLGIRGGSELFLKAIRAFHVEEKAGLSPFSDEEMKQMEKAGWVPANVPDELRDQLAQLRTFAV